MKNKDVAGALKESGAPTPPEEVINEGAEQKVETPETNIEAEKKADPVIESEVEKLEDTENNDDKEPEPEEEHEIDFSKLPSMVWIVMNNGKDKFVSVELAKTLINKNAAKLK